MHTIVRQRMVSVIWFRGGDGRHGWSGEAIAPSGEEEAMGETV